jgi:hypothetical protein
VVGDLFQVIPAFIQRIRELKAQNGRYETTRAAA